MPKSSLSIYYYCTLLSLDSTELVSPIAGLKLYLQLFNYLFTKPPSTISLYGLIVICYLNGHVLDFLSYVLFATYFITPGLMLIGGFETPIYVLSAVLAIGTFLVAYIMDILTITIIYYNNKFNII